jgi:hypothetical protein
VHRGYPRRGNGADMKIKDLPKGTNLLNVKFKVPKGHDECPLKVAYWRSQWGYEHGEAGVWCTEKPEPGRIYPIFLKHLKEALEWEVVDE